MARTKYNFSDIKIGDTILTTNNQIGEIIAIKSYAYLNDKFLRKTMDKVNQETAPFKFNNNRQNGIWYSAITIAIEDKNTKYPTYHLEGIDFIEIKEIIKPVKQDLSLTNKVKNMIISCTYIINNMLKNKH